MKSHSSRKKLLLSSVAMTLVAAVSLGTATFAWFTSSTTASADQINVSTTKASELQVSKADLSWTDSFHYGITENIRPVTSADGTSWYSNVAAKKTEYNATNAGYTQIISSEKGNYVVDEMFNIKNKGGTNATNVKITLTSTVNSAFARIAVVPCETAQTEANTPVAITEENFKANIYGMRKDDSWSPYNGTEKVDGYVTKDVATSATITVKEGTLAQDEVASFRVLVWFEGEDADCYDTTDTGLTVPAIKLSVSADTPTE